MPTQQKWNYYLTITPILLFLAIFLIWATNNEIDEVVRGEGKVIPSGQTKVVQHLEGGIVEQILVKEGQKVDKGEALIKLKQAFFSADLKEKEVELLALLAREIRLNAELANEKRLHFPDELKEKIQNVVRVERNIFSSEMAKNREDVYLLKAQISQRKFELQELDIQLSNLGLELRIAREGLGILERLLKKGAASRKEYISELSRKQSLVTQIDQIRNQIPIVKERLSEANRKINVLKNEQKTKLFKELSAVQNKINQLLEVNKAKVDRENRTTIVSPVTGIINKLHFFTEGGIIRPGDKIIEVTPINDVLMIEAQIKTIDRARIWEGQKVRIEVTAYDFSDYGLLDGELIAISPDSFVDKMGTTYYEVRVRSNNEQFAPDLPILPGMIANVNILTGRKTVLDYLVKPLKAVSQNALIEP
jgi:membrane fusion protein, adhesin transport system